jgi:hypothetical protein
MKLETFKAREAKLLNRFPKQMQETVSRLAIELSCTGDEHLPDFGPYLRVLKTITDSLASKISDHGSASYQRGRDAVCRMF